MSLAKLNSKELYNCNMKKVLKGERQKLMVLNNREETKHRNTEIIFLFDKDKHGIHEMHFTVTEYSGKLFVIENNDTETYLTDLHDFLDTFTNEEKQILLKQIEENKHFKKILNKKEKTETEKKKINKQVDDFLNSL